MDTGKIRVALIFGGASHEHEVSVSLARSVYRAIDQSRYTVLPIAIDRQGHWLDASTSIAVLEGQETMQERGGRRPNVGSPLLYEADVAFPLLHGPHGEDGTIQGYFELLGIPYVGSGVLASSVSMDKSMMRDVFRCAGLPLLPYRVFTENELQNHMDDVVRAIEATLSYPVFVKPAGLGSSIGISKAKTSADLRESLRTALQFDRRIVVEQGIEAREIEIGILGNDEPLYSVIGEIIPANEFYDYEAKYMSNGSKLIIPADLHADQQKYIATLAGEVYRLVRARGLARVDFFLDKRNGRIYVNEINTMPGFTPKSMYPLLWQASGIRYVELIDRLITLALSK